ncbi:MAG: hypothetical protein H0T20_04915 [Actinobacteria bacterium]|nr:hypothetical protein [Actinomycetota bacterium]
MPRCGSAQRRKLVEFFRGHDDLDHGRLLRVSGYFRTPDQDPPIRFSVWNEGGVAQAAVSIDEDEAARLGALLAPRPPRNPPRSFPRLSVRPPACRCLSVGRVGGMLILNTTPLHSTADALNVVVGPRTGTGSYGPELELYDERFGNVLLTYGGEDERLLGGVEAAVDALR